MHFARLLVFLQRIKNGRLWRLVIRNQNFTTIRLTQFKNNCYMSKYEIPYFTASIQAFAQRFSMTRQAAFRYLHEHKGLAFLIEFFDVEHLQSMDETIDDLLIVCRKNGGTLA